MVNKNISFPERQDTNGAFGLKLQALDECQGNAPDQQQQTQE